jgi:16S rRNA (guanine966-N2)-methyltransferase
MRIIAGKYRSRTLKRPPSSQTRPTSDRLRETLFNILAPRIEAVRFLDLCAGTGAVGIEALSRGAAHVTFVDQSRKMCALIATNLRALGIAEADAEVLTSEAEAFVRRQLAKINEPFDIIFFDPPYASDYEQVLSHLGGFVKDDCLVIVEHDKRNDLPEALGSLKRCRVVKQGDSCLTFYVAT